MPDVLECVLDRSTNPHSIDERNRGTSKLRYEITTDAVMASNAVINAALAVGPHPLPQLWSSFSYLGHTISTIYARSISCDRHPNHNNRYIAEVNFWGQARRLARRAGGRYGAVGFDLRFEFA